MTWEQKIKIFELEIKEVYNTLYNSDKEIGSRYLMSSNCDFRLILSAIEEGDMDKTKKALEEAKAVYPLLKKGFELYNSYPGSKKYFVGSDADSVSWACRFEKGELWMSLPKWKGKTGKAKVLLALSRLIRDAETRCLKHPRHQQV